jgi:hypothetical protein
MTKLRILGAVALSSFIAAAALADQPRNVTFPNDQLPASCQVASTDGSTVLCAVPVEHPISVRHLK